MLGVVVACEECEVLPVLVKIAVNHAISGMAVTIITHRIDDQNDIEQIYRVLEEHHHVDLLERITFRYLSTTDDILRYCHALPASGSGPHIVILNEIESYCDPGDFLSVKVCSAIMDAVACNFREKYVFQFFLGVKLSSLRGDPMLFKFLTYRLSKEKAFLLPPSAGSNVRI